MKGLEECRLNRLYLRDAMDVISGKWRLVILHVLEYRPFHFKELSREIGITPRMLSKELQELELHGLVTRTVLNTKPIRVEYAITDYGRSLRDVTRSIKEWGKLHRTNSIK